MPFYCGPPPVLLHLASAGLAREAPRHSFNHPVRLLPLPKGSAIEGPFWSQRRLCDANCDDGKNPPRLRLAWGAGASLDYGRPLGHCYQRGW